MTSKCKYIIYCLLLSLFSCHSHSDNHEAEEEDSPHPAHGVEISHEMAEEFGITVEAVKAGEFYDVIKTSGKIQPATSDIFTVTAKKSGILSLNSGITAGVEVKAGENIGSISADGLQGGDINRAAAANLEAAKKEYERLKPLHKEGLVTTSAFLEAERAYKEAEALAGNKAASGSSALVSPVSGSIQNLFVSSGAFVEVGTPVATVAKNVRLMLVADLPVRESKHLSELESANFLPEGSDRIIRLADLDGKKISANTSAVSGGYIPVYFSFSGSPLSFPGGYAEVFLLCGKREGVISVKKDALIEVQGNKYVYVAEDEHGFEKRLVKTGASDGDRVEILAGLEEGDNIVAKGATVVRMAEVSAVAPPAHNHNH